ncbi:MAB_1171c family putative transporter [Kitasatospora sp. NPDC059646]|uniref:MAB_1171c family putative transporter n=1 Tax=Kitasatospora sp. NPDC059646 TaxID=3346893 RepID=UPI00369CE72D
MIFAVISAALIAIAAWRLPSAFRSGRAQRSLCLTIGLLGLALLLGGRPVGDHLHELLPNSPVLLKHMFGVASAATLIDYLYVVHGRRVRGHLLLLGGAEAALFTLFFLALPRRSGGSFDDVVKQHLGDLRLDAYLACFYAFLGYSMVAGAFLFWSTRQSVPRGLARAGTTCLAVGCTVGTTYTVWRIGVLGVAHVAAPSLAVTDGISDLLMGPSIILIIVGLVLAPLRSLVRYVRHQRSIWHMQPLWSAVVAEFPHLAIGEGQRSRLGELLTIGGRDIDAAHIAFGIRDATHALVPWSPTAGSRATISSDPANEARWLRAALLRKATGEGESTVDPAAIIERQMRGPSAEIRWAAEVARHFNTEARH